MQKLIVLMVFSLLLASCGATTKPGSTGKVVDFSSETETPSIEITPYVDKLAAAEVNYSQTKKLNEEFRIKYKSFNPDGEGYADFKAKSIKEIMSIDEVKPETGKKLYLVEIAIRGNSKNKGEPSTFNQIGDHPSPQFVMVDKSKNQSYVEETPFSDAYTFSHQLFELSKITLDGDQWVNTAIVFQIDGNLKPDLAFRFVNVDNKVEFYDIAQ